MHNFLIQSNKAWALDGWSDFQVIPHTLNRSFIMTLFIARELFDLTKKEKVWPTCVTYIKTSLKITAWLSPTQRDNFPRIISVISNAENYFQLASRNQRHIVQRILCPRVRKKSSQLTISIRAHKHVYNKRYETLLTAGWAAQRSDGQHANGTLLANG